MSEECCNGLSCCIVKLIEGELPFKDSVLPLYLNHIFHSYHDILVKEEVTQDQEYEGHNSKKCILYSEESLTINQDQCLYLCDTASWLKLKNFLHFSWTGNNERFGVSVSRLLVWGGKCTFVWFLQKTDPQFSNDLDLGNCKVWFLMNKGFQRHLEGLVKHRHNLHMGRTSGLKVDMNDRNELGQSGNIQLHMIFEDCKELSFFCHITQDTVLPQLLEAAALYSSKVEFVADPCVNTFGSSPVALVAKRLLSSTDSLWHDTSIIGRSAGKSCSSQDLPRASHNPCNMCSIYPQGQPSTSSSESNSDLIEFQEMDLSQLKEEDTESDAELGVLSLEVSGSVVGGKKRNTTSINETVRFLKDNAFLFQDKSMSRGPICLVECPACDWEYKNTPDRLIRLFNHVTRCHKRNNRILLETVVDNYNPLLIYMKRKVRKLKPHLTQ